MINLNWCSAGCPIISQNLDFAGPLLPCLLVHTFNYIQFGILAGGILFVVYFIKYSGSVFTVALEHQC